MILESDGEQLEGKYCLVGGGMADGGAFGNGSKEHM